MFALRKITHKGIEINFNLGDSYSLITKDFAPEEYMRLMNTMNDVYDDKPVYGFVTGVDGTPIPLCKNQKNYIVSENGATYSNLTFK